MVWWLSKDVPDVIEIRILRVCVPIRGFRTQVIYLATDLLDPEQFPATDLDPILFVATIIQ